MSACLILIFSDVTFGCCVVSCFLLGIDVSISFGDSTMAYGDAY